MREVKTTGIFTAVTLNDIGTLTALLYSGVDINSKNSYGRTPIEVAAYLENWDCVEEIIRLRHDDKNNSGRFNKALLIAAKYNRTETVSRLLEKGALLDQYSKKNGFFAIHYAVQNKNIDLIKILLAFGADLYTKSDYAEQSPIWGLCYDKLLQRVKFDNIFIILKLLPKIKFQKQLIFAPIIIEIDKTELDSVQFVMEIGKHSLDKDVFNEIIYIALKENCHNIISSLIKRSRGSILGEKLLLDYIDYIQRNPSINQLYLEFISDNTPGLYQYLIKAVSKMDQVKEIKIYNSFDNTIGRLVEYLTYNNSNLNSIDMSFCKLNTHSLLLFWGTLLKNRNIKKLDLRYCIISQLNLNALIEMLKQNKSITSIDLRNRNSHIAKQIEEKLPEILAINTSLREIKYTKDIYSEPGEYYFNNKDVLINKYGSLYYFHMLAKSFLLINYNYAKQYYIELPPEIIFNILREVLTDLPLFPANIEHVNQLCYRGEIPLKYSNSEFRTEITQKWYYKRYILPKINMAISALKKDNYLLAFESLKCIRYVNNIGSYLKNVFSYSELELLLNIAIREENDCLIDMFLVCFSNLPKIEVIYEDEHDISNRLDNYLHLAVRKHDSHLLEKILQQIPSSKYYINHRNKENKTVLQLAIELECKDCIYILCRHVEIFSDTNLNSYQLYQLSQLILNINYGSGIKELNLFFHSLFKFKKSVIYIEKIKNELRLNSSLESLAISGFSESEVIGFIKSALLNNSNLRVLDLSELNLTEKLLDTILWFLRRNPTIRELYIKSKYLNDQNALLLRNLIKENYPLTVLRFTGNPNDGFNTRLLQIESVTGVNAYIQSIELMFSNKKIISRSNIYGVLYYFRSIAQTLLWIQKINSFPEEIIFNILLYLYNELANTSKFIADFRNFAQGLPDLDIHSEELLATIWFEKKYKVIPTIPLLSEFKDKWDKSSELPDRESVSNIYIMSNSACIHEYPKEIKLLLTELCLRFSISLLTLGNTNWSEKFEILAFNMSKAYLLSTINLTSECYYLQRKKPENKPTDDLDQSAYKLLYGLYSQIPDEYQIELPRLSLIAQAGTNDEILEAEKILLDSNKNGCYIC